MELSFLNFILLQQKGKQIKGICEKNSENNKKVTFYYFIKKIL